MYQGVNFIQNNLDDSDEETPVNNQQPRGGGQGFPTGGSNPLSKGGNDPMSTFLGVLGGGMGSGQNNPVSQGQNLGGSGSNQLTAMLQGLNSEPELGKEDAQLLSLLQGLRVGAGVAAKGQYPTEPLLSGQRGEAPVSGQLSGLAQLFTGSEGARNDGSSPYGQTNSGGWRGGETSKVGDQGSGQNPTQRFGVGERGGGFPNPSAMPQMFGGAGGISQDGGQSVTGRNKPSIGLGGLGSGSTAGIGSLQNQATQIQAMMQMFGGAGGSPASGAGGGGQPNTEDIEKLMADFKIMQEKGKQNPSARIGINQDSNPDELLAAVTGDGPGRREKGQNIGQGMEQAGGQSPDQAGFQGLGQVGSQSHGSKLGQAGLGGYQTPQDKQVSDLFQLLQKPDMAQGPMPQLQGLGLPQASLGREQIPQGQQIQGMMQLLQNQGQGQGQNSMGGGFAGLGAMGRGLGGFGLMGGSGFPGQVPGRGRGGGGMGNVILEQHQQEVRKALQNQDSRADGPCTVIIADCSGSIQGEPLKDLVQFISEFIDGLEEIQFENGLEENVALITVGANINVPQHLTNNYQKIKNVVNFFHAEGPTHLEIALITVLAVLADAERAIYCTNAHYVLPRVFILTDGKPTKDVDIPGQIMNPEDQNLLVMKNTTIEQAHTVCEKTLATIICVPIGDCDVAFLEMMAGVTGGQVRCLGDAHPLSRNILHHFIAGKMKAAGVKSNDVASVLEAAEELTVADDTDVESILEIIKKDEPDIAEWKSKRLSDDAGSMSGKVEGLPRLQGGMGMGGSGMTGGIGAGIGGPGMGGLFGQGFGGAGMGGPGMAGLFGQGMGGAGMGGPGMAGLFGQGMGGPGMGNAGMAALMNQAMVGAGIGGAGPGIGGYQGMGSLPRMGGGQQPRSKPTSGFLRE